MEGVAVFENLLAIGGGSGGRGSSFRRNGRSVLVGGGGSRIYRNALRGVTGLAAKMSQSSAVCKNCLPLPPLLPPGCPRRSEQSAVFASPCLPQSHLHAPLRVAVISAVPCPYTQILT